MAASGPMPQKQRLRRVLILCRNFACNLAYYRVGRQPEHLHLQKRAENFWRVAAGKINFFSNGKLREVGSSI